MFANGNGHVAANGTCGYDEYVSSIHTISISVVTGKNEMAVQNVPCTGVSAVTYARDGGAGISYPNDLMVCSVLPSGCPKNQVHHFSCYLKEPCAKLSLFLVCM